MSEADRLFVEAAVELAEQGRFTCAPNPAVGCVIWRDGAVIGRGFHQQDGQAHAEVNAISSANGDVAGSTVYVSLEPCAFVGRTPACAQTLIDAEVARVVIGMLDPHPQVSGRGVQMLRAAGITVDVLELDSARRCLRGFASRIERGRPWVRIKSATSLDGATALADGQSQWITGEAARSDVQYWRARSDAIITGVNTILADDPQLNVRAQHLHPVHQPLRVVLDSRLRTPPEAQLLQSDEPVLLVHEPAADIPEPLACARSVELLPHSPQDLPGLLEKLAERGCNEVLVEAGGRVNGSFAQAALWDEWLVYVAPKWLGSARMNVAEFDLDKLGHAPHGRFHQMEQIGNDMRIQIERV